MKDFLAVALVVILMVLGVYFVWAVFIPMRIGEKAVDRKVIENSQQYVTTQKTGLLRFYTEYKKSTDSATQAALKQQMCEMAATIPADEVPTSVKSVVGGCL